MNPPPESGPGQRPESPVERARVSAALTERLASMILAGQFRVGERLLSERELMRRFDASRPAVREAIINLANRGLLKTRVGFRPIICRPSFDFALNSLSQTVSQLVSEEAGFKELFESRVFLESAFARWAALHARREDIQELGRRLAHNQKAIGVRELFEITDAAFHDALYQMPRNPIYPALHRAYVGWLKAHWKQIETSPEVDGMMYAGHESMFRAIVDRDPDLAEAATCRHLQTAWEYLRSTLPATAAPGGSLFPEAAG
ncbi:MAG TPA: FCD domain-containing protein [Chthoniobacterales bacterium]